MRQNVGCGRCVRQRGWREAFRLSSLSPFLGLKGRPVADPFVIATAKNSGGRVVTLESPTAGGARIPAACIDFGVECIDLEQFLEREGLRF